MNSISGGWGFFEFIFYSTLTTVLCRGESVRHLYESCECALCMNVMRRSNHFNIIRYTIGFVEFYNVSIHWVNIKILIFNYGIHVVPCVLNWDSFSKYVNIWDVIRTEAKSTVHVHPQKPNKCETNQYERTLLVQSIHFENGINEKKRNNHTAKNKTNKNKSSHGIRNQIFWRPRTVPPHTYFVHNVWLTVKKKKLYFIWK